MENASKALIMAAGIFMAITLLAIGVNLFVKYRNIAQTYDEVMTLQDVAKINKEFEKYRDRTDITIQEVVAAAKTAMSINEKYGDNTITVTLTDATHSSSNLISLYELEPDNKKKYFFVNLINKEMEKNDLNAGKNYYAELGGIGSDGLITVVNFKK